MCFVIKKNLKKI